MKGIPSYTVGWGSGVCSRGMLENSWIKRSITWTMIVVNYPPGNDQISPPNGKLGKSLTSKVQKKVGDTVDGRNPANHLGCIKPGP